MNLRLLGIFPICILGASLKARASACEVPPAPAIFQSIKDVNAYNGVVSELVQSWSKEIFGDYLSGHRKISDAEKKRCEGIDGFSRALQEVFRDGTLSLLERSGGRKKLFVAKVRAQNFQPFKVLSHYNNPETIAAKAGFHRGQGSIFMSIDNIPAAEWPLIFIHEFAHSLDESLSAALPIFANPAAMEEFTKLGEAQTPIRQWPPETRARLNSWLKAGLDRGYLAECRAWTITFALYKEGLQDKTFAHVEWMDQVLKAQKPNENLKSFTLRYLSARFKNPYFGPLKYAEIQRELKRIRKEILTKEPPSLGDSLESIYSGAQ